MPCSHEPPGNLGLFDESDLQQPARIEVLGPQSRVLRGFALLLGQRRIVKQRQGVSDQ